ncbi:MAG: hypothetical protein CMD93_05765 [Gammaproteobacteria bacterium]|jgi:hypothetical protein|nr:hypothetical protein [Gammaproteobacteria bacterium]|tara:strand:- start:767 stop:1384 length:618 start_codon:yes stop_codon:yes gene_type:complete
MSERKILSKILRLDKNIYSELINLDNALQKGILIYITVTSLNTLSQTRFFGSLLDFIETNLVLIKNEFSDDEFEIIQALVDDYADIFRQQEVTLTLLFSSVFTATIISLIGLSICYLILKFLLSKDPKPSDLIIISCFSSAPGLLVFFALISSNIVAQFFLIMIPGIYALITFASGLKQVYLLRNIEVVLLLVTLIFSGAILGPM